jgi:hypothetical protein
VNRTIWRTRGGVIAAVVLVLVLGTGAVFFLPQDQAQSPADPQASAPTVEQSIAPKPPSQRTLLFQVTDKDGLAVANVLLATGGAVNGGSRIYLSPILLVPTPLPMPLESTVGASDTLQARTGVSMLLGIRVDAAVAFNRLALAALVDAVGGVPIAVRESVRITDAAGKTIESVPLGARTLPGVSAAAYALALQPGEQQSVRMRRFGEVMERVLAELPDDIESMRQLVLSLGSLAKSTATNDELVDTLMLVQAEAATGTSVQVVLPVVTVRSGRAAVMQRPEGPELVDSLLPEARLSPGESRTTRVVLVRAGAPTAAVLAATASLIEAGFTVVDGGRRPRGETMVVIPDVSAGSVSRGAAAAEALGVPVSAVRIDGGVRPTVDVVVLLGSTPTNL